MDEQTPLVQAVLASHVPVGLTCWYLEMGYSSLVSSLALYWASDSCR